jgi:hypothetical protein
MEATKVINEVCRYAGITEDALSMPRRFGCVVTWRRITAYILYDHCGITQQQIALRLGYTKHENTKHHVEKLRYWLSNPTVGPRDEIIATRNILNNLGL